MVLYRYRCKLLYIVFILILNSHLYAQFSEYHSIINPYGFNNNAIYSIGSIAYASYDYSLNIQNNPVGPAHFRTPRIYIGLSQNISRYDIKRNVINFSSIDTKDEQFVQNLTIPNMFCAAFPLKVVNKMFVFTLSVNKTHFPEYELWLENNKYPELGFFHQREGCVWSTSVGISYRFPIGINVGFSLCKWFGHWHWYDYNSSGTISGKGKYQYNGSVVNFGILKRINSLTLCFILHTPFTLMKADNIHLLWGEDLEQYNLQQRFSGAFKIGVAYKLNDNLSVSTGYKYQGKSNMRIDISRLASDEEKNENYGCSHILSIGGEYFLNTPKRIFPIFFVYWINCTPQTPQKIPQQITSSIDINNIDSYGYQFLIKVNSSSKCDMIIIRNIELEF